MLRLVIWPSMMLLGWTETKLWTLKYGSKSIQTSPISRKRPPKPNLLPRSLVDEAEGEIWPSKKIYFSWSAAPFDSCPIPSLKIYAGSTANSDVSYVTNMAQSEKFATFAKNWCRLRGNTTNTNQGFRIFSDYRFCKSKQTGGRLIS